MKKFIGLLLVLTLCSGALAGCSTDNDNTTDTNTGSDAATEEAVEKISVVTTIFPQYDIVRTLAGDNVELTMLLSPGAESHSYDPTPQDIITIQECDIFIYVGGDSDEWVDRILDSIDTDDMEIVALMDMTDVVEEEIVEGMEHDHDHDHDDDHDDDDHDHDDGEHDDDEHDDDEHDDDEHDDDEHDDDEHDDDNHDDDEHDDGHDDDDHETEYDEHVWTSPENAKLLTAGIADVLSERDPENADTYQEAADAYIEELNELSAAFREVVEAASRTTILFGDRFPFRYFVDTYELDYYAAFSGCSTETDASAGTIAFLIEKVKELELPVVYHIEFSNENIADTICEETGAEKMLLHSGHNITKDDFESGVTYLDLMWDNVESLKAGLQ